MKLPQRRLLCALLSIAHITCVSAACGQGGPLIGEIHHHWNLVEVYAGTNTPVAKPNGLLEPGEALRMELTVSITPEVGSVVNWSPSPPEPGHGTVAGLAAMHFDLLSIGDTWGTWSHMSRAPGWGGSNGTPESNGWVRVIHAFQLASSSAPANPANPIEKIWQGVWVPHSYQPRVVEWYRDFMGFPPAHGGLYVQYGIDPVNGGPLYTTFRSWTPAYTVQVTIIPAPGAGAVIVGGLAVLGRRRRH